VVQPHLATKHETAARSHLLGEIGERIRRVKSESEKTHGFISSIKKGLVEVVQQEGNDIVKNTRTNTEFEQQMLDSAPRAE